MLLYSGIVAAVISALVGGIVSYCSNLKMNKKLLELNIMNEGRLRIDRAINEYQEWLKEIFDSIPYKAYEFEQIGSPAEAEWVADASRYRELLFIKSIPLRWVSLIEQYQFLFPKLANLMDELLRRHDEVHNSRPRPGVGRTIRSI